MNTQRVTISIPSYLYQKVKKDAPDKKFSQVVTAALIQHLPVMSDRRDPVKDLMELRKKTAKVKSINTILKAIEKGRM